jgi:DNA-binding MarR family transcriptional regulator
VKAHSIHMVFSPQSCTLDLLASTLTEDRRRLADQLLKQIKSDINRRTASHTLIVGPRGSGKTHILAFVRKTIEASWDRAHELLIMPLAEEEHGLTTLLDFLLVALRSCGHDIRMLNSQFGSRGPEVARADAIKAFDEVSADRAVLIPVENLSTILAALEPGEVDRLRAFLQSHSRVALLASSVELFDDSSRPDHPFHGFFAIEPLRPLVRKDARAFLAQLARSKGDAELEAEIRGRRARPRFNAIYDLTGGNHRLLAMLSAFLSVDGFAELVGPFVQMVDRELTPYYQQRLDRLSPQQKKILMAIANHHGRALSVNEIARYVFSTSQVVSRQLTDMLSGAYVRRTRVGRESLYELNEPLLRLVLDIKEGHDRPLPLIVGFLRRWYHLRELQQLERGAPEVVKMYYTTAIEQAISAAESRVDKKREMTATTESLYTGRPEDKSKAAEGDSDYFSSAFRLAKEGHLDEAIGAYNEIVLRFGESERPELLESVARALVNKGVTLGQLNRSEEEIAVYDEVVNRFGESERPELLNQVARALVNKGFGLGQLNCLRKKSRSTTKS